MEIAEHTHMHTHTHVYSHSHTHAHSHTHTCNTQDTLEVSPDLKVARGFPADFTN